ncbi:HPr(Ser) kinase/phosphatase [Mycoplasma marinum]|uniref:HPr(Ser) kinase/phosphatase n=1 Tax=Mycoplasma marinum TaxID=1937190 RepID=A0A4R0XPY6_9MOLU|nr:HPr(Ser) kinase/phosphatase [Mycoplasma marinum]TCG11622.1 HPr(Ser) kinase/phosphatase [Mycoplasma marinum]
MQKNKLTARVLAENCSFKIANDEHINECIEITSPGIYRAGLELCGFNLTEGSQKNVIVWGTKEQKWFNHIGEEKTKEALENLLSTKPPIIFLSLGIDKKHQNIVTEIANKYEVPIVTTDMHVTDIVSAIRIELSKRFTRTIAVHASLVIINGMGVMIIGKSGIGKSEAVIELINDGHLFVSDDTVNISRVGHEFFGYPAAITKDLLEARGIGLLNIKQIFGVKSVRNSAKIELVVELIDAENSKKEFDRLGNEGLKYKIFGSCIPKTEIPVKRGKSIKSLITAAANLHVAKQEGFDSFSVIQERVRNGEEE